MGSPEGWKVGSMDVSYGSRSPVTDAVYASISKENYRAKRSSCYGHIDFF